MKPLLAALLALLPLGASAMDESPECDVTDSSHAYGGVDKTIDACTPGSGKYDLKRCQQRLPAVMAKCQAKLEKNKRAGAAADIADVQDRLSRLTAADQAAKEAGAKGIVSDEKIGSDPGTWSPEKDKPNGDGGGRARGGGGGRSNGPAGPSKEETILATRDDKKITDLGKDYLDAGAPKDAERVLDKALEINPKNSDALGLRSAAKLAQQRPDEALTDAGAAFALDPNNRLARDILGYTHASQAGKVEMSKPGFEDKEAEPAAHGGGPAAGRDAAQAPAAGAGAQNPAAFNPGQRYLDDAARKFALGDMTGALLDATRTIQADPKDPRAWALRARISNQLKNYEAAIADADEALKLDPKNADALLERGYAEYQMGDYQKALADIDQALVLAPQVGLAHLYRAMVLEKLGRLAEAASEYRKAEALDAALKPLAEQGLARLGGARPGAPAPLRPPPAKLVFWLIAGVTAFGFIFEGIKRVFMPGWKTTGPAHEAEEQPSGPMGTLPPGLVLAGNFRIERELARGGMGIVYAATDLALKRPVAIKQLRADNYALPEARERLLREAQLAAKLRHANLAQIFSIVDEPELFLVFELVEGETLDRVIARGGKLTLGRAKQYAGDICAALEHAHANNVIHRDLKPSNIMVTKEGDCKVMDFGIAHEAKTMSKATQTAGWGTPPYMAPEQEMGSVSRESDLFALAVMTYEMLTGRLPYAGPAFLARKLGKEYPRITTVNPDLPPEADAFFDKALDPDPAKRHPTAQAFMKAFKVLGETPVRA